MVKKRGKTGGGPGSNQYGVKPVQGGTPDPARVERFGASAAGEPDSDPHPNGLPDWTNPATIAEGLRLTYADGLDPTDTRVVLAKLVSDTALVDESSRVYEALEGLTPDTGEWYGALDHSVIAAVDAAAARAGLDPDHPTLGLSEETFGAIAAVHAGDIELGIDAREIALDLFHKEAAGRYNAGDGEDDGEPEDDSYERLHDEADEKAAELDDTELVRLAFELLERDEFDAWIAEHATDA